VGIPGGKTELGENPREALRREWIEEVGLEISVGDELARGSFFHGDEPYTLIAFNVELLNPTSVPTLREHDAYDWTHVNRPRDLALVESDRAECYLPELGIEGPNPESLRPEDNRISGGGMGNFLNSSTSLTRISLSSLS